MDRLSFAIYRHTVFNAGNSKLGNHYYIYSIVPTPPPNHPFNILVHLNSIRNECGSENRERHCHAVIKHINVPSVITVKNDDILPILQYMESYGYAVTPICALYIQTNTHSSRRPIFDVKRIT